MSKRDQLEKVVERETKQIPSFTLETKQEGDLGIVRHYIAGLGNLDDGDDIIASGAFTKTMLDAGRKVKVLDQHSTDSVRRIAGKPLVLREISRSELAPEFLERFPDATGAIEATTQLLLDTPEGQGMFTRARAGVLDWSIGFDVITADYEERAIEGKSVNVRVIRELRLWEYSGVVFAMNALASGTLSAKQQETEAADEKDAHLPSDSPLAVPRDLKDVVGRLRESLTATLEALEDFQATTVSQNGNEEETDAEPPTVVSDAHEETNAVSDEGAGPESDGPSDTPPTSEDVDTLLAQADALLQEVNDELQRGTSGGARPD